MRAPSGVTRHPVAVAAGVAHHGRVRAVARERVGAGQAHDGTGRIAERDALRERERRADAGEAAGALPHEHLVEVAYARAVRGEEVAYLHGPVARAGIEPREHLRVHLAVEGEGDRLRVRGPIYREDVHAVFFAACCWSQASTNGWMWPSITPFTSLVSYSVRRSFTIV